MNREVRKKMRPTKGVWIEEQCKNIEKGMNETAKRPTVH